MRLYELFDEETHYGWSLLYDVSLAKEELMAYYYVCEGNIDCIFEKLMSFNKGFQYIVNSRGREEGMKLIKLNLNKYGIKLEDNE